ncbi:hypothetical protein [Denitratisoma oestradiolicum]|uniref:Type-F conjugative transfer system protein TrbI n=1 Tax=Denitratisoma oestradiolicum TaxID=311182 RepID=A0A6S6XW62_9PROT|nr:hypothetical protein [Denitratisoma oestradiolicum]TWO82153.1 hypothetical protein CBW56_01555 [Denitratisoma oestradiolicum]CAB1369087.1 conserved protein of unknown function [Denitratisoma oestradiolicum]
MSLLKTQFLTGVVTLALGACIAASWLHFRPLEIPRFARIDIGAIVAKQQQSLVQRVKPGMDAAEQGKLFEEAKAFGVRLDAALEQVGRECQCALINTAALLKATSATAIPDLSERVADILKQPATSAPAQ